MPGSTTRIALPYPLATEPVSQGDDAIKALAEAVDTYLQPAATEMVAALGYTTSSTAYRRGKMITLQINATTTAARGANESMCTVPAGMLPPEQLYFIGMDTGSGNPVPASVLTNGVVTSVIARAIDLGFVGTITYAIT